MEAEHIRNTTLSPQTDDATSGNLQDIAHYLREIAAQLAELNESMRAIAGAVRSDTQYGFAALRVKQEE